MRCVAPQNPHPDWSLCYSLLLKATSGYCLDLTKTVALKTQYIGWPDLQVRSHLVFILKKNVKTPPNYLSDAINLWFVKLQPTSFKIIQFGMVNTK